MRIQKNLSILIVASAIVFHALADVTNVQIKAMANADYGINTVAQMMSEVLTAPDGLATYQIVFEVTPPMGRSIRSGVTGTAGGSTAQSWGVGPENTLFNGDDYDAIELIGNLQITNFTANGGELTLNSFFALSFTSVMIANGQSTSDRVLSVANGITNNVNGVKMSANPDILIFDEFAGTDLVTEFTLANGSTNATDKWSVNQVDVSVGIAWRADWMRGAWGLCWAPENLYNGRVETLVDDYEAFLDQISGLKTLDFIQLNLGCSYIYSPVHLGPHDLLESFWQGDVDGEGQPINLIVPRASSGVDPFGEWALATKAAGLKLQVYVNSSQLLQRGDIPNPDVIPDITERWITWCDTNTAAQVFLNSQSYHRDGTHTNRPYMFCYAEFVLKEYSIRYGDLIDGWIFDSGSFMNNNGDDPLNGVAADQKIYQAFADAVHAGNPNAAVAFNNGPERDTEELNPFSEAVHCEDYTFGHPYNGGNNMGSHTLGDPPMYDRNYAHIEKMTETGGNIHEGELTHDWTWDDRIVGHFYPCMSTTAWNAGGTPALTDDEFLLWNLEAMQGGGAIAWGAPLNWPPGTGVNLTIRDWGMAQLTLMDDHLSTNEVPGAPRWARAETPLPNATIGQAYYHVLTEGVDFWDPEGDDLTRVTFSSVVDDLPSWLILEEELGTPRRWILSGMPTETAPSEYKFRLRVADAFAGNDRWVELLIHENSIEFIEGAPGYPVWVANPLEIPDAMVYEAYTNVLIQGFNFHDFEETDLVVSKVEGAGWLSLREVVAGWWQLSGTPSPTDAGLNTLRLRVSNGSNTTDCTLVLTVEPAVTNVSILAVANHNYGIDSVATLLSDDLTAYDGLATFQISVDVIPGAGTAIRSGDGGGATTSQSWGIFSSGETSNARYIFNGDAGETVEGVGNVQIVKFNDGGGRLSVGNIRDLSFASITIADAQSGSKDSVYVTVGSVSNNLGKLDSNNHPINLETLSDVFVPVTHFALGTSTTNELNKWSVNSIEVKYSVLGPESYATWAYDHGLVGADGVPSSDASDSDGYANLLEFALGMNPNSPDAGSRDWIDCTSEGGTNYFELIHYRRSDYVDQGLNFLLIDATNLMNSVSNTNTQDQILVGPAVDGYELITNRYISNQSAEFIKLMIRKD
ncbi:MAG: Ig domain-containing protein [Pontiella sp.]